MKDGTAITASKGKKRKERMEMFMKKKLLSVLLVGAMVCSLAGCGSSKDTAKDTSSAGSSSAGSEIKEDENGAPVKADGSKLMDGVKLTVSSDNYKPYRYQDENGKWIGYDFAVLDALSDVLGFTYDFEEIEFSGVVASVSSGKTDMAPTLCATEERKEVLDFTEPYHIPKPLFAVKKDSDINSVEDLKGKKVAVTFGTTWETMLNEEMSDAKITSMDTLSSVVADVSAGRQDAIFGDSVQIAEYAKDNDLKTISWDVDYNVPADDFGLKKGSEYVEPINKGLEYLKDSGKLAEIQEKWLGKDSVTDWSSVTVTE